MGGVPIRYIKWEVTSGTSGVKGAAFEVAELNLYDSQGQVVEYTLNETITSTIKPVSYSWQADPKSQYPDKMIDNNSKTAFCGNPQTGTIEIDLLEIKYLSGFSLYTFNDMTSYPGRFPVTWSFYGGETKEGMKLLHSIQKFSPPKENNAITQFFLF